MSDTCPVCGSAAHSRPTMHDHKTNTVVVACENCGVLRRIGPDDFDRRTNNHAE